MNAIRHTFEGSRDVRARRAGRGLLAAVAVALALAGCGRTDHIGAESAKGQDAVKARIASEASRHHVALNELECLVLSATKLSCLAHVSGSESSGESTATVIASFNNQTHHFSLEGPPSLIGS